MQKFRAIGASILAVALGSAASATSYPVTFNAGTYTPAPLPVTTVTPSGSSLTDTFTFTTSGQASFSGSLTTRYIFDTTGTTPVLVSDMDFITIRLDNIAWTAEAGNTDALETWALPSTLIAAGDHIVTVTYKVDTADANNGANYGGVFNLATSDVPEPATWALMLGGFGMAGAAMRRSRRVAAIA